MLNPHDDSTRGERPEIVRLIERLASEGRAWAEAEVALAQAEIIELKAQAIGAARYLALGAAAIIAALLALTQSVINLLGAYLHGPGVAALLVGFILMLVALGFMRAARRSLSWRAESIFFRWFGGGTTPGDAP